MRPSKNTEINQDPIHKEQQKLFILLGALGSIQAQLSATIPGRNGLLTKPLDLVKYDAVASQLNIEIRKLIEEVRDQMNNLKAIVNIGGGGGEEK